MRSIKRRISILPADQQYAMSCAAAFARSSSLRNYGSVSGVLRYALLLMKQARSPAAPQVAALSRIAQRLRSGGIDNNTAARLIEQTLADLRITTEIIPSIASEPTAAPGPPPDLIQRT